MPEDSSLSTDYMYKTINVINVCPSYCAHYIEVNKMLLKAKGEEKVAVLSRLTEFVDGGNTFASLLPCWNKS